jgi:MATE family multidrug resistance protein
MAVQLLFFAAIFQVVDGVQVAFMGALRGMKDTYRPMILSVFSYWGVGLVSGYLLAFKAGLNEKGLWLGLVLGLACAAVLLTVRFTKLSRASRT